MVAVLSHEKSKDNYKNPSLSHLMINFNSKENDGKKNISCQTKASILCIPMRRKCQIMQGIEIIRKSTFVAFDKGTLILRNIVEKMFLLQI